MHLIQMVSIYIVENGALICLALLSQADLRLASLLFVAQEKMQRANTGDHAGA